MQLKPRLTFVVEFVFGKSYNVIEIITIFAILFIAFVK